MKNLILSLMVLTAAQVSFAAEKKLTGEKRVDLDSNKIHCKLAELKQFNQQQAPVVETPAVATKGI